MRTNIAVLVVVAGTVGLVTRSEAEANSKYAAIVVDANTGKTLYSANADSRRYPASLTKMMTLYLVFEAMENGRISKNSRVPFSAQAAAQPPTKLGVKAGGSITVETAIYALITRSANDASTALAELIGGSEDRFARMMTSKARNLGMKSTVFRNPHGLPNTAQFTTARDMATLGMALRQHFPKQYKYFSTRSFNYGKQRIANHNRLLGRVKGADGIKTGYTRASGFNLVSSVMVGDRRIVAVVMGGASGAARDNHMAELIKKHLPKASTRRGGALIARGEETEVLPAAVTTMLPKRNAPTPDARPEIEDAVAAVASVIKPSRKAVAAQAYAEPSPRPSEAVGAIDSINTASTAPGGWSIQVSSSPNESEAKSSLAAVQKKARGTLDGASPYTVTFDKAGTVYYRARFGGFPTKSAAWNACDALKKQKIDCYAVIN